MTAALRSSALEHHARATPEAAAVVDGDVVLTWSEWNRASNRLADALSGVGIREGDRIGVRLMNRAEWFVVEAALAKLGAVRVAIAWRLTPPEVRFILGNSHAVGLVFDDDDPVPLVTELTAPAPDGADPIDELRLLVGIGDAAGRAPGITPYASLLERGGDVHRAWGVARSIVYTSGTTGRPKGVHRAATREAEAIDALRRLNEDLKQSIPYGRGDRNLLVAPLNHAAAPSSALATHARGGTVVVDRRFDPEAALRAIAEHRITVTFMVPTMLGRITRLPESTRARYDVSCVRVITTGASVCPGSLKRAVTAMFGPCLYESYGSTETGIVTLLTPRDQERHADSCGRVLDGCDIRVLDDDGREVPRGSIGQIFIQSPVTIRAYVGEERLDDSTLNGGYFTAGDVGRLDADGFLYVLDRKKDMIISGGVNIYPAEVELALCEHPSIQDAAVFGVPCDDLGEVVKAVCERAPGRDVDAESLLAFVAARLAAYKRPRSIDFADELPRNAMGKVLKRELRAPYWAGAGRAI